MNDHRGTLVWVAGAPVQFIKWTANGLIYNRVGSQETIASLSRGTVRRLLREGILHIEGYRPEWAYLEWSDTPPN